MKRGIDTDDPIVELKACRAELGRVLSGLETAGSLLIDARARMEEEARAEARESGAEDEWLEYVAEPDWFEDVEAFLGEYGKDR